MASVLNLYRIRGDCNYTNQLQNKYLARNLVHLNKFWAFAFFYNFRGLESQKRVVSFKFNVKIDSRHRMERTS